MGARLLPLSYQYPDLSEGVDSVGGQLRGDKESAFSGLTKSGRVWRKVPESDARSVRLDINTALVVQRDGDFAQTGVVRHLIDDENQSLHRSPLTLAVCLP